MPLAVDRIGREHIEMWLIHLGRMHKPTTVSVRYRSLQSFFIYEGAPDVKSAGRIFPGSVAPRRGGGGRGARRGWAPIGRQGGRCRGCSEVRGGQSKPGRRPPVGEGLTGRSVAPGRMAVRSPLRLRW
jgi:hypothetical protein